jgi:phosphotransferase system, enzyme I, PtsP
LLILLFTHGKKWYRGVPVGTCYLSLTVAPFLKPISPLLSAMAGPKDKIELICDVGELVHMFKSTDSLTDFLRQVVHVVAFHMQAAVCSIYLFDERNSTLVLVANQGLSAEAVGNTRLKITEGITGAAFKERRIICEGRARLSPYWKAVPGINEEHYESFMAVPIMRGLERVGVLVIQDPQPDYFTARDTKAFQAIAVQLATVIQNAELILGAQGRLLGEIESEAAPRVKVFIKGTSPVPGVVEGRILCMTGKAATSLTAPDETSVHPHQLERFDAALERTEEQLNRLQIEMDSGMGDVASLIFSAHLLILMDDSFSGAMREKIREGQSAQQAIVEVVNQYLVFFASSENPRMREKVYDVKDLGHRLLGNLQDSTSPEVDYEGCILVADELLPSEMVKFAAQKAEAVAVMHGAQAAHITILARSLQMPLLFADPDELLEVPDGTPVIFDATAGMLYLNPDAGIRAQYASALREREHHRRGPRDDIKETTHTADGTRVRLMANVNLLNDARVALDFKAEGIGLYRSEFPFIVRNTFPSEEEQVHIYRRLFTAMDGREVVLRTLDVGGDKYLPYHEIGRENNPFLGLRAIRFTLSNPEVMLTQLRAMLRAAAGYSVRIMFPFVSSLDDLRAARRLVNRALEELRKENVDHQPAPQIGIMVEVPACLEVLPEIAQEADFLSVGTNDLIQYLLAVDRTNDRVSCFYVAHHPSVLRALKRIADAGVRASCPVSVCGDMASDSVLCWFLAGIGIQTFSMDPRMIPRVQRSLASGTINEMKAFASSLLAAGTVAETTGLVKDLNARLSGSSARNDENPLAG